MMTKFEEVFADDPWSNFDGPLYPKGSLLLKGDNRFWVSLDDDSNLVFFALVKVNVDNFVVPEFRGLNINLVKSEDNFKLVCTLLDSSLRHKFGVVVKDVAYSCSNFTGESFLHEVLNTLQSWSNFLKPKRAGISKSVLTGIWGELYVLRNFFINSLDANSSVQSWIGAEGKKQDFSFEGRSFEIKTSLSGDPKTLNITSLDQLDKSSEYLYLVSLFLDNASTKGVSLEKLIQEILDEIESAFMQTQFLKKVNEICSDASEEQLAQRYVLIKLVTYEVKDHFPILSSSTVPNGVVDAEYKISIPSLFEFIVEQDLSELITS